MAYAILALSLASLGLVTTFVVLYTREMSKRHKAELDFKTLELAHKQAVQTVGSLKSERQRLKNQITVLRGQAKELENELAKTGTSDTIRKLLDKLLSEEMSENDKGSS